MRTLVFSYTELTAALDTDPFNINPILIQNGSMTL